MAISRNTLMGIGVTAFGVSLIMASGPFGAAFGAAMLYSVLAAVTFASLLHLASSANVSVGFWPSFHRPLMRSFWPTHSRTFVPSRPLSTHSRSFAGGHPVAPNRATSRSVHTRAFPAAPRTFTPAHTMTTPTHTRTFVPAPTPAPTHTRKFVWGGHR